MPVIGRFFLVIAVPLFTQACQAACNNEMIQRAESPTRSYAAILFERNCGATSGNNFQVSILRSEIVADGPGNTFVVDYPDEYYQQNRPRPAVKLHWTSDSSVTIEYSNGARIFTQAVMIEGVKVRYVTR